MNTRRTAPAYGFGSSSQRPATASPEMLRSPGPGAYQSNSSVGRQYTSRMRTSENVHVRFVLRAGTACVVAFRLSNRIVLGRVAAAGGCEWVVCEGGRAVSACRG